jgi:hypothetical protein
VPGPAAATRASRLAGLLDAALGWVIGAIAAWTVLFHLAMALGWHRDLAGGLWVATLAGVAAGLWWQRGHRTLAWVGPVLRPVVPERRSAIVVLAVALVAAALSATRWLDTRPGWWVVWALVVLTMAGAVLVVARAAPAPVPSRVVPDPSAEGGGPGGWAVALVLAVALAAAIGSAVTQRPDADDVFLVNRSTYVAERPGPLPERDTIFADQVFAVPRPDVVPTSFEPLVGVVAAWSPLAAPTVTYLLVGPLVSGLAVLALWRLLRTLGAAAPAAATAAATAFVLLDGAQHSAFGNLHFARAWQGKVVFLIVVAPAIWHHALRWGRDGSRRDLAMLAVANVAAAGLTSTAMFVAPSITAVAVAAGAWAAAAWRRIGWGVATAVPVVAAAVAAVVVSRQDPSPELAASLAATAPWAGMIAAVDPGEQWHRIFGDGLGLVVPVAAVLVAWALVRDRAARLALALAPLVLFAGFYAPGVLDALTEVAGSASILWRVAWVLPVTAAVGLLVTAPALLAPSSRRTALSLAVPVAMVAAMVAGSSWVLDEGNMAARVGWPAWDVDPDARVAAEALIELSEPGDVVLAPEVVGGVLAIRTTHVHPVNPRFAYMRGRHAVPEFLGPERDLASRAVHTGVPPELAEDLVEAVVVLDVATACVTAGLPDTDVDAALAAAGLAPVATDAHCTYWRRTG